MPIELWSSRAAPWCAVGLALAGLLVVTVFVDVSPKVEGEFFFAEDDPQMQASEAVRARFPTGSQLLLRVVDRAGDRVAYEARIAALTAELVELEPIESGYSIAGGSADNSPLFSRILLTPDPAATNIVLQADDTDPELLLPMLEAVVGRYETDQMDVAISGVPAIVEMIRRSLYRDLVVFSLSAVVVFALLIGLVYRDVAVVVGMLSTCFVSVATTLVIVQAMGVPIGLLTANLVTIVFVLTLSHVVFLTANWKRASGGGDHARALEHGIRQTLEPSFWSMATTLLGFLSLLIATARPLRELGVAGSVGTVTALVVAYTVYPAFLGRWAKARAPGFADRTGMGPLKGRWLVPAITIVVVVVALGVPRLDTDPSLLSYFSEDSAIREGLDRIDVDGGTSTLDIVVRAPDGTPVHDPEVFRSMEALQEALESDPAVGVVVSPTVLIGHARTLPLANLLPVGMLLDIASSERLDRVALGYVTPERDQARFSLRMRETGKPDRDAVIGRLSGLVEREGLEPVAIAGLYDLQSQLGKLIASSLRIGIGGLLLLFLGVALVVSRKGRTATQMWACLVAIPTVILGTFGHLGIAVDIITSPAANIALAIGADSMIHLVVRVRTLAAAADPMPWANGVAQIGRPVLGATSIICAGFGIFVLSSFPPTQRFGLAVIVGTLAAATMALVVLPRIAAPVVAES